MPEAAHGIMLPPMFSDRRDAGRRLAELVARELADHPGPPDVVLGLARGGVPVAAEVAARLAAPLDVIVARKLGTPWQPELAMGAIAEGGGRVLNEGLISELGITPDDIAEATASEARELERRVARYRGDRRPLDVAGRTAILVDDGLATGATARAAIDALRARGAVRVLLAVPVAPPGAAASLRSVADAVIVAETPEAFDAVGSWYADFRQTSDDEVTAILAAQPARGRSA